MGSIHYQRTLIHTCNIERRTQARNSIGELYPQWDTTAGTWAVAPGGTAVACRYVEKRERVNDRNTGFQMIDEQWLLFNDGVDVLVQDRIVGIARSGTALSVGTFGIQAVLDRNTGSAHHIRCDLEQVD